MAARLENSRRIFRPSPCRPVRLNCDWQAAGRIIGSDRAIILLFVRILALSSLARTLFGSCLFSAVACLAAAAEWPAIVPAELAATHGQIDPEAAVEVLESVTVIDQRASSGISTEVYMRLKVFTAVGVDQVSKVEIPFDRRTARVKEIEARTIRPDGSVVAVKNQDIFEREVVKGGGVREHLMSFAPPAIEPGAIIEYRYRMVDDRFVGFFPFVFQGAKPARKITYRFRPTSRLPPSIIMQALFFHYPQRELKADRSGYYEFTMTNQPAVKDESFAPPIFYRCAAVLLYYIYSVPDEPARYWPRISADLLRDTKSKAKPTKTVKAEAARLIAGAATDDEKLRRIHDFCRGEIRNIHRPGLTNEQRKKLSENYSAADTLKHRYGTAGDIRRLFVALAIAAGFDARLALGNDRRAIMFEPSLAIPFAFTDPLAAVRRGDAWVFFDPGATYLPPATVPWHNGETAAIIANEPSSLIVQVASAPTAHSLRHQRAALSINEDGSLEGDVTLSYAGYYEWNEKEELESAGPAEIEKYLLATIEPHLQGAEISAIKVENADKALAPLKITYRLKVPDFAERTGARLFVQPSVFRRGGRALFEAEKRDSMILFRHRANEIDDISISVPEGFDIEAASAPADIDLGTAGNYRVNLRWAPKSRTVLYRREFQLNSIGFPAASYAKIKRLFEVIHERDNHTLTFRQSAPPDENQP